MLDYVVFFAAPRRIFVETTGGIYNNGFFADVYE
jgi:hypothetical protein